MSKLAGSSKREGDKQTRTNNTVSPIRAKVLSGFALYYQVHGDELRMPLLTKANHSAN